MKRKTFYGVILVAVVVILGLIFAFGGHKKDANDQKDKDQIQVVASVDFYGEAAKAVLGNHGKVTSIIDNPNLDPHDYEPTAKVAKNVAKSDLVLYNGIGYDSWMKKLAKNGKVKQVRVGEDILNKKDGDNPHLWYSTKTMPAVANYLAEEFGKIEPSHKKEFEANAKKYIASLKPIQTTVDELKANSDNKLADVSEPVFDYSLQELGYRKNNNHFSKSVEDGTDPSPKDIKAMQDDIKSKKISFFVQNTQATDKTVDSLVSLAKENDVPVLKVTETMPKGQNYKQWMLSQYNQLKKIQETEK